MEERRHNNQDLHTAVSLLEQKLTNFMDGTVEYRKNLCAKLDGNRTKLDTIELKLAAMPCEVRKVKYESLNNQVRSLWAAFAIIFTAIVGVVIKGK